MRRLKIYLVSERVYPSVYPTVTNEPTNRSKVGAHFGLLATEIWFNSNYTSKFVSVMCVIILSQKTKQETNIYCLFQVVDNHFFYMIS